MEKPSNSRKKRTLLDLPANVQLSDREHALATRFVNLLRFGGYWLPCFIECLMEIDYESGADGITPWHNKIAKLIEHFKVVENVSVIGEDLKGLEGRLMDQMEIRICRQNKPILSNADADNFEFYDLVKMWRLDHPEPPKQRQIPQGHLGREESGD